MFRRKSKHGFFYSLEIVIRFLEEGQETMTFSTTEGGGYTGIVTYYGGWIRA